LGWLPVEVCILPKRTLVLSCVVYGPSDRGASDSPEEDVPALF
jgi:hypothetical protein